MASGDGPSRSEGLSGSMPLVRLALAQVRSKVGFSIQGCTLLEVPLLKLKLSWAGPNK